MSHQDVLHGNNLDLLAAVRDNFAHAVVTDPPYGLGFMGKDWDAALPDPRTWAECLRVLRPGGHLVAFGAPRLVHRLTCQIEDAGFEVRDQLLWVFAQGFPKSLDVSKAIDAAAGAVREVVGFDASAIARQNKQPTNDTQCAKSNPQSVGVVTAPATPDAARWSGWGTALKPAYEPIVLARKPLDGTVAQTVQRWGAGAINVDGCRVETDDNLNGGAYSKERQPSTSEWAGIHKSTGTEYVQPLGRWPANLILDEAAGAMLDEPARFFKDATFDTEELIIHRAKAMVWGWNPDLASTVDDSSTLPRAFVDSALNDVATWAALGVTLSVEWTGPTTGVTPKESRRIVEVATATILSIAQGCSLEWLRGRRFQSSSLVEHAERSAQTDITRITVSRWKSNGSVDPVTFSITPKTSEPGAPGSVSGDRFIYCPKASRSEREAGLRHLPPRVVDPLREDDAAARDNPRTGAGRSGEGRRNHHATVKPIELMRWLVRLICPPGGIVLEPFAGSGTTPAACALEGVDCIAMEIDAEYVAIARARVAHAVQQREEELAAKIEASRQMDLDLGDAS